MMQSAYLSEPNSPASAVNVDVVSRSHFSLATMQRRVRLYHNFFLAPQGAFRLHRITNYLTHTSKKRLCVAATRRLFIHTIAFLMIANLAADQTVLAQDFCNTVNKLANEAHGGFINLHPDEMGNTSFSLPGVEYCDLTGGDLMCHWTNVPRDQQAEQATTLAEAIHQCFNSSTYWTCTSTTGRITTTIQTKGVEFVVGNLGDRVVLLTSSKITRKCCSC